MNANGTSSTTRRDEIPAKAARLSMVKAKFGNSVRSKTDTAQRNEILLKLLNHNLCRLVNSIYEIGLEPTFWAAKDAG